MINTSNGIETMATIFCRLISYYHKYPINQDNTKRETALAAVRELLFYNCPMDALDKKNQCACSIVFCLSCSTKYILPMRVEHPFYTKCTNCVEKHEMPSIYYSIKGCFNKYYNPMILIFNTLPIELQNNIIQLLIDKGDSL